MKSNPKTRLPEITKWATMLVDDGKGKGKGGGRQSLAHL